jgi:hypothetical protein
MARPDNGFAKVLQHTLAEAFRHIAIPAVRASCSSA